MKDSMMNTATDDLATSVGPVDFLVLEFQGNNFNGDIMRNLIELVAAGTIRIIDLVVVTKSMYGSVSTMEMQELVGDASDALAPLQATINEMITRDDLSAIAEELANNTTAAVLLYENLWAVKTMKSMIEANGRLLAFQRIPHQVVVEALQDIAAMRIA
jgi:hypothetical protein